MIETSGHMPECPWPTEPCSHTPMQDREPLLCMDCLTECICDRLRACEKRVRQEMDRSAFLLDQGDPYREAHRAGYRRGLAASYEVVSWTQDIDDALDAINALADMDDPREPRGMPNPPQLPPSVGVPEKWRP